jgi:hypothetical protein
MSLENLSPLESSIITAIASSQRPMTLISLMIATAGCYSSVGVGCRLLMHKGLLVRGRIKSGYVYQLTTEVYEALQAKGALSHKASPHCHEKRQ